MPSGREYAARFAEMAQQAMAPQLGGLEEGLRNLEANLSNSITQLLPGLDALRRVDLSAGGKLVDEAIAAAEQAKDRECRGLVAGLARFAADMRRAETQQEILELLLGAAQGCSPRCVLFVAKEEGFTAWAARGFAAEASERITRGSYPRGEMPLLNSVLEAESVVTFREPASHPELWNVLSSDGTQGWHLFPLAVMGRKAAILLVEEAADASMDLDFISTAVSLTELCIENISLKILEEMRDAEEGEEEPEEIPGVEREVAPPQEESFAGTEAPVPLVPGPEVPQPPPSPEVCVPEPEIPLPAEPAGTEPPELRPESTQTAPEPPETILPPTPPDQERQHADARRFARLLVSEIKLYNEHKVAEGRANRDLYDRLKRDIDRSREMYQKRVPSAVTMKLDYLHDEIVRILADGDPAKLGSDYPGPGTES